MCVCVYKCWEERLIAKPLSCMFGMELAVPDRTSGCSDRATWGWMDAKEGAVWEDERKKGQEEMAGCDKRVRTILQRGIVDLFQCPNRHSISVLYQVS